ncbi:hypothetical protein F4778DRAFT_754888 [Xylariomycetidae sp. FL2044]|nr:hypothetical protein F4778DRAFT_754888 [Xylariomycetidae sp. FL2044]
MKRERKKGVVVEDRVSRHLGPEKKIGFVFVSVSFCLLAGGRGFVFIYQPVFPLWAPFWSGVCSLRDQVFLSQQIEVVPPSLSLLFFFIFFLFFFLLPPVS